MQDDMDRFTRLPDGIYDADKGYVVVRKGKVTDYRDPTCYLSYVMRATRHDPVPYRGSVEGDHTKRVPTYRQMTSHLPPVLRDSDVARHVAEDVLDRNPDYRAKKTGEIDFSRIDDLMKKVREFTDQLRREGKLN